jgi:GntR family transcriptional regulator, transcriptional repressor for pyruvate dehydrogenase complex
MSDDTVAPDLSVKLDGGRSVREATIEALLARIRSGSLPAGALLPSERELAAQIGVSRGTLREAIRILDFSGVLDVRTRTGTYVADGALSKRIELRTNAAVLGEESPLDIMVARRALEPVSARYAALNRHVRDLRLLKDSVREQGRLIEAGEDPDEVDRAFHIAVAIASRNPLLHTLFASVADVMKQRMWRELKQRTRSKGGHQELYLRQHRLIAAAIEKGDSAAAAAAMVDHLDAVEEGLLAEVD